MPRSLCALLLATLAACQPLAGDGNITEESREIGYFDSIRVEGPIDMLASTVATPSDAYFSLRADSNLHEIVETDIIGSILYIELTEPIETGTLEVSLGQPGIAGVFQAGNGNLVVEDVSVNNFKVTAEGFGTMVVTGDIVSSELVTTGGASVDLGQLITRFVQLEHTASETLTVHATEEVSGEITGTGDVIIKGEPAVRDVQELGTGTAIFE